MLKRDMDLDLLGLRSMSTTIALGEIYVGISIFSLSALFSIASL